MSDQNADEVIIVKYLVEAQDAIARAKEFRSNVNKIKEELKSLASQSGKSFKDIAEGMRQSVKISFQNQINEIRLLGATAKLSSQQIQTLISPLQQARQTRLTEINTALKETETSSKNLGSSFGMVGTAIGTALGFTTYQLVARFFGLIKDGVQWLFQAATAGYEFSKALFQMQIGINALRRAGVDITFMDMYENLAKLKKEFGIFSTTELVQGAAAFLNLNRDMGFTKKQLFELQEAIATLAVVNGRSMEEVQRTVALALSSGYTEGLQRLGVSINRVTIAQEAGRLGFKDNYMALTEVQRAQATYNLILQKTAVYAEDLSEYQKTLAGQIDKTDASITDLNRKAGENVVSFKFWGEKIKELWAWMKLAFTEINVGIGVIKDLTSVVQHITVYWDALVNNFLETINANMQLAQSFFKVGFSIKSVKDTLSGITTNYKDYWAEVQKIMSQEILVSEPEIAEKKTTPLTDEQVDAVNNGIQKIKDIETQAAIDRRDAAIELERDLSNIARDGIQERIDIYNSYKAKIAQIDQQAGFDIADATEKYNLDVQQAQSDYQNNIAQAAEQHSNRMLKIEEDYQEKLLRLREGFLLDLEDALQARDARQVLTLIRRYNLEKQQAKRERDQNAKEEERNYKEQLASLDRQQADRLKKLRQEFEARLRAIEVQRQRELEQERASAIAKMQQQKIEEDRKVADRKLKYQQELDDQARHNQDQIDEIAKGFVDAGIVTQEGMDAVYEILKGYIGSDGTMLQLWLSYTQAIAQMLAMAFGAASIAPPTGTLGNWDVYGQTSNQTKNNQNPNKPSKKAQGGLEIATKPTMAIYGEGGVPELHAFIPLPGGIGSLSSSSSSIAKVPEISSAGKKGKAQVEILLGAGLEGRIVDQALDNMADIIIRRKTH